MSPPSSARSRDPHGPSQSDLSDMVDRVDAAARGGEGHVGALVDAAGPRGTVPLMTLFGLLIATPLSAIPLMSSLAGLMIALCAFQAAVGRRRVWLPGVLRRRGTDPARVIHALTRVRRIADWLERRGTARIWPLSRPPMTQIFLLVATLYGLSMPFLEFVPFSSSLLGLSVALIGLGLMLRDGVLLLASLVPPLVAGTIIYSVWFT